MNRKKGKDYLKAMSSDEIYVYEIAKLYEEIFLKLFQDVYVGEYVIRKNVIPKTKDPRKSWVYKNCFRLVRELSNVFKGIDDFREYITANLLIMKINYVNSKGNVHLDPAVICGDKAWSRWKLYQRWKKEREQQKLAEM